jgi:hypothetical protein
VIQPVRLYTQTGAPPPIRAPCVTCPSISLRSLPPHDAVSVTKLTAGILTGLALLQAISVFGGTKTATHAERQRQSHIGQEDKRLAELLDQLGPKAACVLFHCTDDAAGHVVATQASKRVGNNSQYSHVEFLAVLKRLGGEYDWVRPVVAEPTPKVKKHRKGRP